MATFNVASRRITMKHATSDDSQPIRVSVYFNEGGLNYFNYKTEPKGYWISAEPVKVENGFETSRPFSHGSRHFVEETKRYNAKRLEAIFAERASYEWYRPMVEAAAAQVGVTLI